MSGDTEAPRGAPLRPSSPASRRGTGVTTAAHSRAPETASSGGRGRTPSPGCPPRTGEAPLEPEDLERLATAAYLPGGDEESVMRGSVRIASRGGATCSGPPEAPAGRSSSC